MKHLPQRDYQNDQEEEEKEDEQTYENREDGGEQRNRTKMDILRC